MNNYTVVIPTTNNLVGITDIVVEDPLVSSVICENNSLEALPISNQYDSFVKSPTGIIEKITGIRSYRIDITNIIQQGDSWQLGIAFAHIFHENKTLNFSTYKNLITDNSNSVIWASGTINSNLDVKGINYIDKKINNSLSFFKKCIGQEITIKIVLSSENSEDFKNFFKNNKFLTNAIEKNKIKLIFIKNLNDFFDNKDLKFTSKIKNISPYIKYNIQKQLKRIILISIISSILFCAFNIWHVITPLIKLKENNNYRLLLTNLSSYRQGDFSQRVSAYFFDYYQGFETSKLNKQIILNFIPYSNQEILKNICIKKDNLFNSVCNLNVEATNVGNQKIFLWMLKFSEDDYSTLEKNKISPVNPQIINGMIASEETISIDINENNKSTTLFFVYGKKIDLKIRGWLVNLNKRHSLLSSTIKRVKSLGYGYKIKKINNVKVIKDIL